ncbi:MAG TPA: hypothetical protein PLY50_10195 [Burkholderiaceae bacterium]|nr:hypothetical protein [Burkholderiaceae bacterium]
MGGGGDDGTAQLRADEAARQAKIQAAVDAINAKFGIAPSGPVGVAPTQAQFTTPAVAGGQTYSGGREGVYTDVPGSPASFDQAGFDAAMKAFQAGQTDVSGAKTARDALYADIGDATTQTATRDLDKQFTRASDQNIFGLARAGLSGGSVDAESGGDLQSRYGEGKIRAKQAGIGAASDLKSVDEKTRQNLIGLAQSGIDTGTAASLAAGQSAAAADVARANTAGASIGQLFDNMGQAYLNNRVATAQYPNGLPQQSSGSSFFGNLFTGKGYSGKVTA